MTTETPGDGGATIGITVQPDHPVFGVVCDRLTARGHDVRFFDSNAPIPADDLRDLSLFVVKHTRPESIRALLAAERLGVPTWNSATGVQACATRFSQLCSLSGVGFTVPSASREKPAGDYVSKRLYHWESAPEVNGEGDCYEELLDAEPVDYKYYVVDDGETHHPVVLRATSKLWGEKQVLGETTPHSEHVERIVSLMDALGMRGLGVDLVRVDDDWYAVDLNPCPGFAETGLEDALVASIESALDR
ncbi:histidine kinase [Salinirubrum litoreum]|uniref:Histidine kinase n=1 Tax=Salinirubrum litoreum TaxID=1126234 RepID=A0ABD5RFW8_9EURY|nr:histidine kinase [Salinirubrum litoreum]